MIDFLIGVKNDDILMLLICIVYALFYIDEYANRYKSKLFEDILDLLSEINTVGR